MNLILQAIEQSKQELQSDQPGELTASRAQEVIEQARNCWRELAAEERQTLSRAAQELRALLEHHRIRLVPDEAASAGYRVEIDGADTGTRLFDPEVSSAVSTVAALPGVRTAMVAEQRAIAEEGPVVMAGRDIGTVVLPDARFKFYLTASVDERADRRAKEFAERGLDVGIDEVREQIEERDRLDRNRAVAPLRAATDAVVIDSTALQASDVLVRMRAIIEAAS